MFWRIAWFEIKFWLRSWMLWIFFGVIAEEAGQTSARSPASRLAQPAIGN